MDSFVFKDCGDVALSLYRESDNEIETAIFHQDISDTDRLGAQLRWNMGQTKVICATIGEYAYPPPSSPVLKAVSFRSWNR
jgi:hypothetical protein